jgi:hypothetical protein
VSSTFDVHDLLFCSSFLILLASCRIAERQIEKERQRKFGERRRSVAPEEKSLSDGEDE